MVLYIHGHVYNNIHWIIFVTTSNSALKSRKQIYIYNIKIQKYHYFNQCIWRFAYHTSNHNYHEYKFVYYINTNAAATTNNNTNYNNVTGIAQLNAFSCAKNLKTPSFYLLPKIHKSNNPGSPIVNNIGSITEKISAFVDEHLRKFTPRLLSYMQDTTHLINIMKNIQLDPDDLFVTTDVSSLYTNIPHTEGI